MIQQLNNSNNKQAKFELKKSKMQKKKKKIQNASQFSFWNKIYMYLFAKQK